MQVFYCVFGIGGKLVPGDSVLLLVELGYRHEMCTASSRGEPPLLIRTVKTKSLTLYKLVTRLTVPLLGMWKNGNRYNR